MDNEVLAAMARWPDVPAVCGWLSLTESGQWRLHPTGDAVRNPGAPGESITSPQILAFIDRNYDVDSDGRWFFQNGPQRVYVRLDAAPYILRTATDSGSGRLMLRTHTGLDIRRIEALFLDENGRLYMATDRGPGLVAGRDLPALFDALQAVSAPTATDAPELSSGHDESATGQSVDMEDAIAACMQNGQTVWLRAQGLQGFPDAPLALTPAASDHLEALLGYCRLPQAQ